jgi:hypothetical protein
MAHKKRKYAKITGIRTLRNAMKMLWRNPEAAKHMREFLELYNDAGDIEDQIKYSGDPVVKAIYPIYQEAVKEINPIVKEKHVRGVIKDGASFIIWVMSGDSAYRPFRDWLLSKLLEPEKLKELRDALEQEKQGGFDYDIPDNWYDNLRYDAVQIDKEKHEKGLLKDDQVSSEKLQFVDKIDRENFIEKLKNKEV